MEVDYDFIDVAGKSYLLPSHSDARMLRGARQIANVVNFVGLSQVPGGIHHRLRRPQIMTPNPYDVIPYPTIPRAQLHPGRLAAVGRLFGLEPAPVARCRVLEIGCGDGGNLIPMAYFLPESRFTGVDLAAAPIAAAQHMASALEMRNLDLRVGDLREIDEAWGEFDYILAPGVYSWVPEDARDALLTVCRERLAAQGIAYISYNAYPGGHLRQALREMMLHQARDASGPRETVRIAREFLQQLQRAGALAPAWHELRDHEVKALLERDDGALYHDDLAEWNQRFYFHEFMAAANGHGLDYVGEAFVTPLNKRANVSFNAASRSLALDGISFRKSGNISKASRVG